MTVDKKMPEKSDAELVMLSLQNQEDFLHIMKRYEGKLLNYIRRISGVNLEDAEDILQDVFIKVYLNLAGYDQGLKFSSWTYRITRNEVISDFRKRRARPKVIWDFNSEMLHNLMSDFDLSAQINNSLNNEIIFKILDRLDEKYKEVLVLKFFEEKSYEEIADIIKKPVGSVATLLHRAKKQFRREMQAQKIKL